jgi:hypothetical protein
MYRIAGKRDSARTIRRNAHGAVLELHRDAPKVPELHKHWHYDLRRNRLCIYGGLLRFIDCCIAAGKPHIARQVVSWLDWYVTSETEPTTEAVLKRVA